MNNYKGFFIAQTILFFIAIVLIAGGAYYAGTKNSQTIIPTQNISTIPIVNENKYDSVTYWDTKNKFSFNYPSNLTLSKQGDVTIISHTISFDNYDGGCDMKGDAVLSKNLDDLYIKIYIVPNNSLSIPSYAENYSAGELNGKKSYMGAEGCGRTSYYFSISGNRMLVIDKSEVQILSGVVAPEVRSKLLSVPGVITQEEGNMIVEKIIESIYVDPVILKTNKINTQISSYGTQGSCGFNITYPLANAKVKFPLSISGTVDNSNYEELGCRWIISEGQAAVAKLYYNNNGWIQVGSGIPINFTGYNNNKATFTKVLNFTNNINLPSNTPMKIVFEDVNEMDGSVTSTFELPINFTN